MRYLAPHRLIRPANPRAGWSRPPELVAPVARALKFYAGALGFQSIDEFNYEGRVVYARLRSPGSDSTIALHQLERGKTLAPGEGVRLYLEIEDVEAYCKKLEKAGDALDGPAHL